MTPLQKAYQKLQLPPDATVEQARVAITVIRGRHRADPGSDPWDLEEAERAMETIERLANQPLAPPTPEPSPTEIPSSPQAFPSEASGQTLPSDSAEPETPKHLLWKAFFQQLPLQTETSYFILVSMLDVFMTYIVISFGAVESNPVADFFLQLGGFDAMLFFKMLMIAFVTVLAQVIARRDPVAARRVLIVGIVVLSCTVIYSAMLLRRLV